MSESKVISFRIGLEAHELLTKRAASSNRTASEHARETLLQDLHGKMEERDPVLAGLPAEVAHLRLAIERLRSDYQLGLKALLVTVAKVPVEEVDRWMAGEME